MSWAVIVFGGAKEIAPEETEPHRVGCLRAVASAARVLGAGGSAIEAAEAAIVVLEDDPTFNAGFGSVSNSDGEIEMDSGLMDGASLDIGAVAAIQGVRHPVSVARSLLRERPILLAGSAARQFAKRSGAELCPPEAMIAPKQRAPSGDTVGCVVLDSRGHLAAATSTGGLKDVMAGRVGDSPLPGCGYYADDRIGALAFSGEGEDIARVVLARRTLDGFGAAEPSDAIAAALRLLEPFGAEAGGIGIDAQGRIGWAHNSRDFSVAYARDDAEPRAFIRKSEEQTAP